MFVSGATVLAARRMRAASVESITTVSMLPEYYHGWPTLARRTNGDLLLVCSGGRESHICPFGRVELMRSRDGGGT
jgi:sialidase-1